MSPAGREGTGGGRASDSMAPLATVRLVVPDPHRRVLLLRRAETDYASGGWCLPGGKVDYGETVEEAVHRELREETALECGEVRFLFVQDNLPSAPGRMHCINLYFECVAHGALRLNAESSEAAWVGPGELDAYDIAFRNDEALRRYWGIAS